VHDPRLGRRNKAETLESGRIVRERDRPVPPGPPAQRSERRRELGHAPDRSSAAIARRATERPGATNHARTSATSGDCAFAPPRRKTARAKPPPMRSAPVRRGSVATKRRSGIARCVAAPGSARRGRHVLKGNKPHERRPIDRTSRRPAITKRINAATVGPVVQGHARSARASPIDSEGASGRGHRTPRRTRESRGDVVGTGRANG